MGRDERQANVRKVSVILGLAAAATAALGAINQGTPEVTSAVRSASYAVGVLEKADDDPLADGGWWLESYNLAPDAGGDFGGESVIRNDSGRDVESAGLELLVLDGAEVVATMTAVAHDVPDGASVAVQWVSGDPFLERTESHVVELRIGWDF